MSRRCAYKQPVCVVCLWVHNKFFLTSKTNATLPFPLILWMAVSPPSCALCLLLLLFLPYQSQASDTLTANQQLSGNQKLISQDGNFALGFFKPGGLRILMLNGTAEDRTGNEPMKNRRSTALAGTG